MGKSPAVGSAQVARCIKSVLVGWVFEVQHGLFNVPTLYETRCFCLLVQRKVVVFVGPWKRAEEALCKGSLGQGHQMASPSKSPDWSRPSPPPQRSRSQSKSRWVLKENTEAQEEQRKEEGGWGWGSQEWESRGSQEWEGRGWQSSWKEDKWGPKWPPRWQGRPRKEGPPNSSTTSGSYRERERLATLREEIKPTNPEEEKRVRLLAMSGSRYKRLVGRKEEREEEERKKAEEEARKREEENKKEQEWFQKGASWMAMQWQPQQPMWGYQPYYGYEGSFAVLFFML